MKSLKFGPSIINCRNANRNLYGDWVVIQKLRQIEEERETERKKERARIREMRGEKYTE